MSQLGSVSCCPGAANGSLGRSDGVTKMSAKDLFEQRKKYSNSNIIMHETSQYHVQHLATFIMDKSEAIVSVDDAIRKLVQLSSKEKVWTQEMLLQVNDQSLRLLDIESQEELENFPLPTVRHSQTVLNQLRYPSVLLLVCQDSEQSKPDIHFFYCDEVEADLVHEDIESALADCRQGKKMRPQTLKGHQEKIRQRQSVLPPPKDPAPIPFQRYGSDSPTSKNRVGPPMPLSEPGFRRRESQDEEPRALLAQKIEKETQILNCALDDIEWFVARLQKAAEAFKQLNQRKKGKKKGKKGPAEGVLTLRARPPSEAQFVDCFQKIKLAINLLAKLQKHIQNPSAAELVHFLFGPLDLIVSTCGGPDIARSVTSPLLSRDAVGFLRGHLVPKETMLWESLGETWTRPRFEWPREPLVPLYVPKFHSGWEPPLDVLQDAPWEVEAPENELIPANRLSFRSSPKHNLVSEPTCPPPGDIPPAVSSPQAHRGYAPAPAMAKYVRILYDFTARNANELSVLKDEVLEVLEDDHQWWKLRNRSGQAGYVPCNILDETRLEDAPLDQVSGGASALRRGGGHRGGGAGAEPRAQNAPWGRGGAAGRPGEGRGGRRSRSRRRPHPLPSPHPRPAGRSEILGSLQPHPQAAPELRGGQRRADPPHGRGQRRAHQEDQPHQDAAAAELPRGAQPARGPAAHLRVRARRGPRLAGGQGLQRPDRGEPGHPDGPAALLAQQGRAEEGVRRGGHPRVQPAHRAEGGPGGAARWVGAGGAHEQVSFQEPEEGGGRQLDAAPGPVHLRRGRRT